jgi:hypothetical protein
MRTVPISRPKARRRSEQIFRRIEMPAGAYRIAAVGAQLGMGAADSTHLTVHAIGKGNGPNAPYCIANELICAELGRFLRLPVPPGGIVTGASHLPLYASLNFNLAGVDLPPVRPSGCVRLFPFLATGIVLFDILIANSDRHSANLSVDLSTKPAQMNVFDHSHALFGSTPGQAADRIAAFTGRLGITGGDYTGGNRHCLLDHLDSDKDFPAWIERIAAIPDFFFDEVCADALPFGVSKAEVAVAQDFLKERRATLPQLINDNRAEFRSITTWTLL